MGSFPLDQLLKQGNISRIRFEQLDAHTDTSLRDYQIANKAKIYSAWRESRSVMLQMPTGTGKTRLFVSIVKDLHNWGARNKTAVKVLLLAHRKELIDQIDHNLGIDYGLAHGLIISQSIEQKKYPVQIGSVPTLNRRLAKWADKDFDVIIIDEAHHVKAQSYKKILAEFPSAKILGVTATPYRLNGAGFRPEFDCLIISDPISQFIQRGYLSDYKYYSIKSQSKLQDDIDKMALNLDGDYLDSAMMSVMDTAEIRANIVNTYLKYARGKKGIVYTINKAHNTHIQHRFIEAGIKAETVDSDTPKEQRDEIVNRFRRGEIDILCNVNIFSEGFDCPDVEFIQLARPTRSLAMYLQQVGRGLRPAPGKEKLIILDNVGLYNRFGFPSARRKWQHHFEGQAVIEDDRRASFVESVEGEDNHIIYSIEEGNEAVHLLHDSQNEHEGQSYIEEFYDYMLKTGVNTKKATQYKYIINNEIDHLIREFVDAKHKSIACCVDAELVTYIYNTLVNHKGFISINNQNNNKFASALLKYTEFTSQYSSQQPTSMVGETPDIEQPIPTMENGAINEEIKELSEAIKSYESLGIEPPKDWIDKLQALKEAIDPEFQLKGLLQNIIEKYRLGDLLNINYSSNDPQYFASVRHNIAKAINQALDELNSIEKILATAKKTKLSLPDAVVKRKELCKKTIANSDKLITAIKEIEAVVGKWTKPGLQLNIVIHSGEIEVSSRQANTVEQKGYGHKKEAFSFSLVDIPIGAIVTFTPTNTNVRVVDNKHIEYRGKIYTLSGFTVEFMPKHLQIASGAYQGPKFFSYKNERLTDRRERLGK